LALRNGTISQPSDPGMQQIRHLPNSGYKLAIRLIGEEMKPQP
jgi:hypothetical protein